MSARFDEMSQQQNKKITPSDNPHQQQQQSWCIAVRSSAPFVSLFHLLADRTFISSILAYNAELVHVYSDLRM